MRQMTDHVLEIIKGGLPILGPFIDYQAIYNATQVSVITGGFIPKGRCISLNSSGEWVLGVGATNATLSVPFFALNNSDDYDVKNDGGTLSTDYNAWSPGGPTGKANAVCGLFAGELETTEFQTALTYSYNQALTAPLQSSGTASDLANTAGKLTNASVKPYLSVVVGYVSRPNVAGATKNAHGKPVLRFWSTFLPKLDTSTTINYN